MKIEKVKVWAVIEGPYNLQTLSTNYPYEIPPDCNHLVVCKVEKKRNLLIKNFGLRMKKMLTDLNHMLTRRWKPL